MIIKRRHTGNFAIIPNAVMSDTRISLEARGLLGYLLSKPDNWEVNVNDLRRAGNGLGKNKVYKLLNELVAVGYISRHQPRDEAGHMLPVQYEVYDVAQEMLPEEPETDITPVPDIGEADGEPRPHSPRPALPRPVNREAVLYKDNNKTDNNNTDSHKPREREREDSGNDGPKQQDDKKTIEKQFKAFGPTWPTWISDSEPQARKEWFALTDDDRAKAVSRKRDYLNAVAKDHRTKICSLAVYLREKRWVKLPEPAAKAGEPVVLKKYGHSWMAYRLSLLSKPRRIWHPSGFIKSQVEDGNGGAFDDSRWRAEFPLLAQIDADAEKLKDVHLPPTTTVPSHEGFVQIAADSDAFEAWGDWHQANDYPWIEPPDCIKWIWMPSEFPPATSTAADDETQEFLRATR